MMPFLSLVCLQMSGFIDGICLARGVGVARGGGLKAGGEEVGGGHGDSVFGAVWQIDE